ncbi:hypothetical protein CU098_008785 [Rhizopus stolonifer]|uniref:Mannosyltransferase n=1 Tax=Rhizopus stolonifer TaxID=4846 RepID=A0A367KW73_RHIST|nr:hypothetical protein CU098_008785 [Rhizopus stolonifer]
MTGNIEQKSTSSSRLFVFITCAVFRLFNAYFTRTYDNADEYWQGQEVAHYLVFGNGYLTWEWRERIRSFAHPLAIAAVYKVIQLLGLEHTDLLIMAPRYLQAILTAVADMATYNFAKKVLGNQIALPMLFTTLCSWFNFHMAARTLSNSMEMVFTMIALNYWPLPGIATTVGRAWIKDYRIALVFASFACIMRPTNGLIWLFLGCQLLLVSKSRIKVAANAFMICTLIVLLNMLIDSRLYHQSWTDVVFTPYSFFKVNVINNISLFYGVHTWHWYLSQGLPVIFTTFLPFIGIGLYHIYSHPQVYHRIKFLLALIVWVLGIYSVLPHKEFRFIFPVVPLLLMVSAYGLQQTQRRKAALLFLLLTQLPMAFYLSLWHQRGVVDVMLWLRSEAQSKPISVGVMMPCHSTPWYSIVHQNIPMWFLTCEPPLSGTYSLDEADQFYAAPLEFTKTHQKDRQWPPSHLVLFENLLPQLGDYLQEQGYRECQRFFNSHFHDDSRRRG